MVVLSKFFDEAIRHQTCNSLLHNGSCVEHCLHSILPYIRSNFMFFAPIVLFSLLAKIRTINKKRVEKILKHYVACVLTGIAAGWSMTVCMCLFRHVQGEFRLYNFAYIPTLITSHLIYITRPSVAQLFAHSMLQCNIEAFLIKGANPLARSIANSILLQTLIFMCCSALVLHGKRTNIFAGFWPLPANSQLGQSSDCSRCDAHPQLTCGKYFLNGVCGCLAIGLLLDFFKMLLSTTPPKYRFRSTAFLTTYLGIYRFVHCLLNRCTASKATRNHLLAAFCGGASYLFYPRSTLLSFAIIQALQTVASIIRHKADEPTTNHRIWKRLLDVPYARLLFPITLANMVHNFCFHPQYDRFMAAPIINGLTNNYSKHIRNNIQEMRTKWKQQNN